MKSKIFALLACFLCLAACGEEKSEVKQAQYNIEDEYTYSILMYDLNNSLILSILGAPSNIPDQAAQIDAISRQHPEIVADATLRLALLKGGVNMPEIKQKTIENLHQAQVNLMKTNITPEQFSQVMKDYMTQLAKVRENMEKTKSLSLEDAMIDAVIFNPQIDYSSFDENLPKPMIAMAGQIAVTRQDNQLWHKNIGQCVEKKPQDEKIKSVVGCAEEYFKAVKAEMTKVLEELSPYRKDFEMTRPMPDKEKMEKVESADGSSYKWQEKK